MSVERKTGWKVQNVILYYKKVGNLACVQPVDRLIALLNELAFSLEDAHDTLKNYHKKNRRDRRVLERVRIMQAMYLVQSSVGDLALKSLSVEKQPPAAQVVDIQDDEERNGDDQQEEED